MSEQALISIRNLSRNFKQRSGLAGRQMIVRAVRDVSLDIARGETLGVVGESGCGKSTLGRMSVSLLQPDSGDVFIDELPLFDHKAHTDYKAFRRNLAGRVQMVFQDPYSSLNPRMRIGDSVAEPLVCSSRPDITPKGKSDKQAIDERVALVLAQVGMAPDTAGRYPHEFSGGQRQRVAIARALVTRPDFVVCDEPTSSLDASVQSQVLNLLRDMQEELGLTYMFISHDLAVVRHMSDRVAVMYRGLLVEEGASDTILTGPRHPYTRLLLDSIPGGTGTDRYFATATQSAAAPHVEEWGIDSLEAAADHCPFAPRCPQVMSICRKSMPDFVPEPGGCKVRCFLYEPGK